MHGEGYYHRHQSRRARTQLHGAAANGSAMFRKKCCAGQVLTFLSRQPTCTVAMEACATAHHWGRKVKKLSHRVQVIPSVYVKPIVETAKERRRQDHRRGGGAAGQVARCSKTEDQQAQAMVFRSRDLLVRQRTQSINALWGHLADTGSWRRKGLRNRGALAVSSEDEQAGLPPLVREIGQTYLGQIKDATQRIAALVAKLRAAAADNKITVRFETMPASNRSPPWRSRPLHCKWRRVSQGARLLSLARPQPEAALDRGKQLLAKT